MDAQTAARIAQYGSLFKLIEKLINVGLRWPVYDD